ncbi:MAG TPA: 2-oxoacid:ferredoxin oxidoreductase subunit beta [Acidobacteriota bacterium]|nr:2-oxoacid:ferredoxin oxidoreductase subunit beta [Acidobacteriota bacterium]
MSSTARPSGNLNQLGLTKADYKGATSTLCAGCGHDAISSQISRTFFEMGVNPYRVAKMSGIGCSSKTPAYFLGRSHGFNSVHGRMPSVATGAVVANRDLLCLGVSGDGDTASIGLGQFCHMLRRNIPMIYVLENNGVYGLTKGQFSATSEMGARLRSGAANDLPAIDICKLAIEMGCSYVARSFAADPRQVVALLKGALSHNGTAVVDILSPCVTFNDHDTSMKSYRWGKEHEELLHQIDFIPHFEQLPEVNYEEGEMQQVELHDGSVIQLRKVEKDYDPTNNAHAFKMLRETREAHEFLTGLIYIDPNASSFIDRLNLVDEPLALLNEDQLRPGPEVLNQLMEEFM